jgi:hypothetical protein
LDGTCLHVADTAANEAEFGWPGTGRGQGVGAFPQLRLVALSETGTHAICAAAMGPLSEGENALADRLLPGLGPGVLCLADRGFYSFERFQHARQTGAALLWRVKHNQVLPREQQLPDGSYLTRIYANQPDQRAHRDGQQVRVVEYQIDDGLAREEEQRYRLLCTILDPENAPAGELGALYHERWELENALDELKVHQRGPRVDAALQADLDPDRLSFTTSLRAARRSARTQPGFSPPSRSPPRMSTRSPRSSRTRSDPAGCGPTRA